MHCYKHFAILSQWNEQCQPDTTAAAAAAAKKAQQRPHFLRVLKRKPPGREAAGVILQGHRRKRPALYIALSKTPLTLVTTCFSCNPREDATGHTQSLGKQATGQRLFEGNVHNKLLKIMHDKAGPVQYQFKLSPLHNLLFKFSLTRFNGILYLEYCYHCR